jgi:predicted nucleotidyltransferase
MRFHHSLQQILGNSVRLRVLRVLFGFTGGGLTGRELARRAAASVSQTITALEQLETAGVVHREVAGRAHLWLLSKEHVLFGALARLFADEASTLGLLKRDLGAAVGKLPVERAWLFGSIARGDEHPSSDIDLLVEVKSRADRERVEESLSGLSAQFALRFGNPLSTTVAETARFRSRSPSDFLVRAQLEGLPLSE